MLHDSSGVNALALETLPGRAVRRLLAVLLAVLLPAALACADADECPMDLPDESTCASDVPSYSREVSGVLDQYCTVCHLPGNRQSTKVFASYDQIYANRRTMLTTIYNCRMPIGPRRLTARNRALLLKWFVCGAPSN